MNPEEQLQQQPQSSSPPSVVQMWAGGDGPAPEDLSCGKMTPPKQRMNPDDAAPGASDQGGDNGKDGTNLRILKSRYEPLDLKEDKTQVRCICFPVTADHKGTDLLCFCAGRFVTGESSHPPPCTTFFSSLRTMRSSRLPLLQSPSSSKNREVLPSSRSKRTRISCKRAPPEAFAAPAALGAGP